MFLNLVKSLQSGRCVGGFAKQIHTQMCLAALFDRRRKVENEWKKIENEWDDDEHEQKRAFHEEEMRVRLQMQQLKCEITGAAKRPGSVDCTCKGMCMARKSGTPDTL